MNRSAVLSHRLDARVAGSAITARVGAGDSGGTTIIILGVLGLGLVVAGMTPRKGW